MATKYARTVGGNWNTDATWSTTSGGAADTVKPTAADDVVLDANSGAITIDAASVCRSLNCTGYTNTLTHNAFTLTIGDATAGAGNIALKLVSGMTYTLANVTTSAITFASTNTTQQTVDFGGKNVGNIVFGSSGTPNYAVISAITQDATASVFSTFGHLSMDGVSNNSGLSHTIGFWDSSASNVRTINLGACTITLAWNSGSKTVWNMGVTANITLSAGSSTITSNGNTVGGTTLTFTSGNKIYGTLNLAGPNEWSISGTFTNLTRNGTSDSAGRNCLQLNPLASGSLNTISLKVTGTFTLTGESTIKRALLWPSSNGVYSLIDVTGCTLNFTNVNFQDIKFKNGGGNLDFSGMTGGSGDCGGNSMADGGTITFTPATTQHWLSGVAGNVSDVTKWTSRIPLPQDSCVFDTTFSGSPKILLDMMFTGSLDFRGGAGNVTYSAGYSGANFVGNFYGRSGVTITNESSCSIYLNSRVSTTVFYFNSCTWSAITQSSAANGGNITIMDSGNIGASFQPRSGTITVPSDVTFGVDSITSNANNALAPVSFIVSGILNIRGGSGTIFSMVNSATLTSITGFGKIGITSTSASSKTFAGGGNTYPTISITGGGAGAVIFTGANTFTRIEVIGGTKSITLPGSTTTTLLSGMTLGNGTNVVTFTASAGSATLSLAAGKLSWDYVNLTNIPSTGGASFYAGANSTDGTGNTGWTFTAPPSESVRFGSIRVGI